MDCPVCRQAKTEVLETRRQRPGTDVARRHRCPCGKTWWSVQKALRNTIADTTGRLPVAYGQSTGRPKPATGSPPVAYGGVGGGLSSAPVLSGILLESPPDLSEARSEKIVKVMSPPKYAAEFERFWAASDKEGSKSDASKAWEQVGRPDVDQLASSRLAWLEHWGGIGVKHISTWLRAFDWQQDPGPRRAPPPTALAPARNFRAENNHQAGEEYLALQAARRGT